MTPIIRKCSNWGIPDQARMSSAVEIVYMLEIRSSVYFWYTKSFKPTELGIFFIGVY